MYQLLSGDGIVSVLSQKRNRPLSLRTLRAPLALSIHEPFAGIAETL